MLEMGYNGINGSLDTRHDMARNGSCTHFIVPTRRYRPKLYKWTTTTRGSRSRSRSRCNPSGRAPALTLAGYAPCDRAPPEMHPLKMFEILGHPHFKQLHGHKIPMNATNLPDRLNLYIFSLNLSYHSFVSVHDIQQKRLMNKISVYAFTHPGGHHRVANVTLFVACTRDGCATRDVIRGHVITIMTLISFTEFKNLYCPEQCIFHSDRAHC